MSRHEGSTARPTVADFFRNSYCDSSEDGDAEPKGNVNPNGKIDLEGG
jgi:hypothetical protein